MMRRQSAQVWLVLGVFLFFSMCLPLGHVCSEHVLGGRQQSADLATRAIAKSQGTARVQDTEWQAPLFESQQNDICQACLLIQNLILNHAVAEIAVLRIIVNVPESVRDSVIVSSDPFKSAFKRAPPSSR